MNTETKPGTPTKAELAKKLAKLESDLEEAQDPEPFIKEAEEVLLKMESDMPAGMQCLTQMNGTVASKMHVVSEIGRVRRLFRVMTGIRKSLGEAGRRAKNSPIQGISSEAGVVAGYLAYSECWRYSRRDTVKGELAKWLKKFSDKKPLSKISRLVHDASYFNTPYPLLLPQIHIGLWNATTGVARYYEEHFDFKMDAPPEVELELCAREDKTYKWDWELPNLGIIIRKSLEDQKELGYLDYSVDRAMKEIFWCYTDVEEREYLYEHWPFLDVPYTKVKAQVELLLEQQGLN